MGGLLLVSIIIPILNEEENILPLYNKLTKVFDGFRGKYECEIIFIDDGSKDRSLDVIKSLADRDPRIKFVEFSRNFGKEIALSAGIHFCKGDAAIMIDGDLQHPPEIMSEFIKKWRDGYDVVIGLRRENGSEKLIKRMGSFWFYKIINFIGEEKLTPNATDYRLLDKKVIVEFNRFTEKNRITRGIINWLGFKRSYIRFDAPGRNSGKAGYDCLKLTKLAFSAFVNHSLFPLKFAGYLGLVITFFSGILGLFIFIEKYILKDPWRFDFSGPAILAVIILFLIGVVLICLGLMAIYIGNIHREVINRPMYAARSRKL